MFKRVFVLCLVATTFINNAVAAKSAAVTLTVSETSVYIGGNVIEAPYTLSIDDTSLSINGIAVLPIFASDHKAPIAVTPISSECRNRDTLTQDIVRLYNQMSRAGSGRQATLEAIRQKLMNSGLVSTATIVDEGLLVKWLNGRTETFSDSEMENSSPPPTLQEILTLRQQQLQDILQNGGMVIIDSAGNWMSVPAQRRSEISAEIQTAQNIPATQLKSVWSANQHALLIGYAQEFAHPIPLPAKKEK